MRKHRRLKGGGTTFTCSSRSTYSIREEEQSNQDVASCIDIEEDHLGEIEDQLTLTRHLPHQVDVDLIEPLPNEADDDANLHDTTFYHPGIQDPDFQMLPVMPEEAEYCDIIGGCSSNGHCFERSSISDSIGQLPTGSHLQEARIGSAFFTPRNNLCQLRSQLGQEGGVGSTTVGTLNRRNLKFL